MELRNYVCSELQNPESKKEPLDLGPLDLWTLDLGTLSPPLDHPIPDDPYDTLSRRVREQT